MKPVIRFLGVALAFCAVPAFADSLDTWLAENAIPLRTLDGADEDLGDLEPLFQAIGTSRVVMLGEPSHGAGSAFAAKVRLIRFLHHRMGFDVVAWESGLFDVRLAQAALADLQQDPAKAAQAGILPVWSRASEVRPLFEYARSTLSTPRPLEMAGFDMNASAPGTGEKFAVELRGFFSSVRDPDLRARGINLADQFIAATQRIRARDGTPPTATDLSRMQQGARDLNALLSSERAELARVHAPREIGWVACLVANVEASVTTTWHRRCCEAPAGDSAIRLQSDAWNRRDSRMAANLLWLLEQRYAGRKVVVWAHNAHLMRQHFAADWKSVNARPQRDGMTPMGALVGKKLGNAVYSIALTSYEGEEAWANGQKQGPIAPAPAGSLEARLHALNQSILFIDLRSSRGRMAQPLRTPTTLRISGYGEPTGRYGNEPVADLAATFDGILFIDRMAPATRLPD